jgi:hypothetical protein
MYKDALQVDKFKKLLIFLVFISEIYHFLGGESEVRRMACLMHLFGYQGNKKLAKVDGDCYPIRFVLSSELYCKPLITGNSQWVHL